MPMPSKNTLLIDLHPARVMFTLSNHARDPRFETPQVFPTSEFTEVPPGGRMRAALDRCLEAVKLKPQAASVVMSVPAPIISTRIEMPGMPEWNFDSEGLKHASKVKGLAVINDMTACTLALPELLLAGQYEGIGEARPRTRDFPILMLTFRPDVGAAALVPSPWGERDEQGEAPWLPLPAEVGPVEINLFPEYTDILSAIERSHAPLLTAHDVLSEKGIREIYRAAANDQNADVPALNDMCDADDGTPARTTVDLWCRSLGSLARNLALAYGARGGVYIFGETALAFLNKNCLENRIQLRSQFEIRGPTVRYLKEIPVFLVTHENPILQGLSRLEVS